MKIETQSHEVPATLRTTLYHAEVGHGISVFRRHQEVCTGAEVPPMLVSQLKATVTEGFAKTADINTFLETGAVFATLRQYVVMPQAALDNIAKIGYVRAMELAYKDGVALDSVFENPYRALVEQGMPMENVVRNDVSSHMVFALDDTPKPNAVRYEYLSGHMHDGVYDLKMAIELLTANPRVQFFNGDAKELRVPYYNQDRYKSAYLMFTVEMTQEDEVALWERQKGYNKQYPSTERHRAMFDLDLLGLRAAGAAYYDDYYMSREFDDDYKKSRGWTEESDAD